MILLFSGFILLESFFYILQKKSDLILSKKNKFTPILLVLPSFEDVKYIQSTKDNYYQNYFKTVNSDYKFWDFSENLINENEVEKFFIDDIWGGHYNSDGNRRVAKFIERKIYENKIII